MSREDVDELIGGYFSGEEWRAFSEDEKLRIRLIFVNYVNHPEQAHITPIPQFLNNPKGELFLRELTNSRVIKKKTRRGKRKSVVDNNTEVKIETKYSDISKKVRRNPERDSKRKILNYQEEEIPEDDRYIFCDECQKDVVDYCDTCGMLVVVKDVHVPIGVPDRARKTVPLIFEIRESTVHGLGVFVKLRLPQGIQLGPYEGTVTRVSNTKGYSWKLRNGKLVDAGDETISNWMRYVNCAPHSTAQNLVAFQYKGELFYRTARPIQKGEELLVYYGNSFARELGIEPKKYFDPQIEIQLKQYFTCKYCHVGLISQKFRDAHEKKCSFQKKVHTGETFACTHCTVLYSAKEDRDTHENRCRKNPIKQQRLKAFENLKEKYACRQCDYKTKQQGDLKRHMLIHNKENAPKYICGTCCFKTMHKHSLQGHLRRHSTFGFICKCCGKSFKQKIHLDNHYVSKHSDEQDTWKGIITNKINECAKCPYKSADVAKLRDHLLTHDDGHDRMKYNCRVCGYTFNHKSSFKVHLRIHVSLQPFVCTECYKKFNNKVQLDGHILSKHSNNERLMNTVTNKVHSCTKCSYKTVKSHNFKGHFKSNHEQQ